jgi:hypothetical protein
VDLLGEARLGVEEVADVLRLRKQPAVLNPA